MNDSSYWISQISVSLVDYGGGGGGGANGGAYVSLVVDSIKVTNWLEAIENSVDFPFYGSLVYLFLFSSVD
ncbi:hypothetical protein C5167_038507 [Papaver somniferum]|uniref:Uncharacterized protein n=1 Tax=Papaver somniferum TaxID=3469 RepID=A0A4Y7IDP2_PAPSO|nr:hypothetical protein C5167_038507 [Papaver somniferum]